MNRTNCDIAICIDIYILFLFNECIMCVECSVMLGKSFLVVIKLVSFCLFEKSLHSRVSATRRVPLIIKALSLLYNIFNYEFVINIYDIIYDIIINEMNMERPTELLITSPAKNGRFYKDKKTFL